MSQISRRLFVQSTLIGCAGLVAATPARANMDPIRVTSKYPSLIRGLTIGELKLDKPSYKVGEPIGFSVTVDLTNLKSKSVLRGSLVAYIDSGDTIEDERELKSLTFDPKTTKTVTLHFTGPAAKKPGAGKTFIVMGGDEAGDMVAVDVT